VGEKEKEIYAEALARTAGESKDALNHMLDVQRVFLFDQWGGSVSGRGI